MYQKVLIWLLKIFYQDNSKGSKFLPDTTRVASNLYKRSSSLCNVILYKKPFLVRTNSATTFTNTCEYGSEGYQVPNNPKHFSFFTLRKKYYGTLYRKFLLQYQVSNFPLFISSWPFGKTGVFLFWICTLTKENPLRNVET